MAVPFIVSVGALSAVGPFDCGAVQGPRSCTSVNFTEEGSSKVIVTNISSCPEMLLYQKNNSFSEQKQILTIKNSNIYFLDNRFMDYFIIEDNNFVMNVNKVLPGCYKFATDLSGSCLLRFCLGIPGSVLGSEATDVAPCVTIAIILLVLGVVLCYGVYRYWKRQRKERDRNGPASQFKSVPNHENGSLQNGICMQ